MKELMRYYSLLQAPLMGKIMFAFNIYNFITSLRQLHVAIAVLILISNLSCTLPMMYGHRQESIRDFVFLKRVIFPGFLGMTISVILFAFYGAYVAGWPYGLNYYESMGVFFENRGIFFIVMSNLCLIQMILKEAAPEDKQKKMKIILFIPALLMLIL